MSKLEDALDGGIGLSDDALRSFGMMQTRAQRTTSYALWALVIVMVYYILR